MHSWSRLKLYNLQGAGNLSFSIALLVSGWPERMGISEYRVCQLKRSHISYFCLLTLERVQSPTVSTWCSRGVYWGKWTQLASKLGSGEEHYTLKGEEFPQIYGSYVKSETLDSCRFETKKRQNAPNPISISIFSRTPATGALPQTPGRGGRGGEGKGKGRERGGEGKGKEGKGRGGGSLRHCRWGIDAPVVRT